MVPVTPLFPLFKLPYIAWRNVLETMRVIDLLKSSLCSRRLKRLVRSLFPKSKTLSVSFARDELGLSFHTENFELHPFNYTLQGRSSLYFCKSSLSVSRLQGERVSYGSFDVKQWIRHLMDSLNCDGISLNFSCDSFEMEHVKRVVEGLQVHGLSLSGSVSNTYYVKALEAFQPAQQLSLGRKPEPFPRDIIAKNYQYISLRFPVTLEEVLTLTSQSISIHFISPEDFNTLLKKWMDGWNPELRTMSMRVKGNNENYESVVFDGLEYKKSFTLTSKQAAESEYMVPEYEIKRNDGMMATIVIHPSSGFNYRYTQISIKPI